jgi:hypothetical protein
MSRGTDRTGPLEAPLLANADSQMPNDLESVDWLSKGRKESTTLTSHRVTEEYGKSGMEGLSISMRCVRHGPSAALARSDSKALLQYVGYRTEGSACGNEVWPLS